MAWSPRDPKTISCCVLMSGYRPSEGAYCCGGAGIADALFPPIQPTQNLNCLRRKCCVLEANRRAPISYSGYLARKEFRGW